MSDVSSSVRAPPKAVQDKYNGMTPAQKKVVAGVGIAAAVYASYRIIRCLITSSSHKQRDELLEEMEEDDQVHLFMFPRSPWAPSLSAPCSKVETFLRVARIPYDVMLTFDSYGSPNQYMPFIVYKGQRIADPTRIIDFLTSEFGVDVDGNLSAEHRSVGKALLSMLTYSVSPAFNRIAYVRYPSIGTYMIAHSLHIPTPVASVVCRVYAKVILQNLQTTTDSHLTREQFEYRFESDCEAIEQQLGNKPFLFGDAPTSYDCAVYAMLIPFVRVKTFTEVSDAFHAVSRSRILVEYLERMTELAFPDLDEIRAATEAARSELLEEEGETAEAEDESV